MHRQAPHSISSSLHNSIGYNNNNNNNNINYYNYYYSTTLLLHRDIDHRWYENEHGDLHVSQQTHCTDPPTTTTRTTTTNCYYYYYYYNYYSAAAATDAIPIRCTVNASSVPHTQFRRDYNNSAILLRSLCWRRVRNYVHGGKISWWTAFRTNTSVCTAFTV